MNGDSLRATLRVTKALADLQRVRILKMLQPGELCVCQIVEVLGLAPSTVSKHLSILNHAGLVDSRKDGRWMYYRLPVGADGDVVRPVLRWIGRALKNDRTILEDGRERKVVVACDPECVCRWQRKGARRNRSALPGAPHG